MYGDILSLNGRNNSDTKKTTFKNVWVTTVVVTQTLSHAMSNNSS